MSWVFVPIVALGFFLKVLKRRYMMGKVTVKELPEDHPIFKSGWLMSTLKSQSRKIQEFERSLLRKKAIKKKG